MSSKFRVCITAGKGGRMKKLVVNTDAVNQFEAIQLAAEAVPIHRPRAPKTLLFHVSVQEPENTEVVSL